MRGVRRRRNYIGVALKLLPLITKCFKCQTFIGLDRLWVQKIEEHLKNEITSQVEQSILIWYFILSKSFKDSISCKVHNSQRVCSEFVCNCFFSWLDIFVLGCETCMISKNIDMNVIVVTDEMCPKELYYKDIIFNQVENKWQWKFKLVVPLFVQLVQVHYTFIYIYKH